MIWKTLYTASALVVSLSEAMKGAPTGDMVGEVMAAKVKEM